MKKTNIKIEKVIIKQMKLKIRINSKVILNGGFKIG